MTFRGWKVEALEFYEGLEADNSKAYWTRNKETYDTLVRAPMEELVAELEPEFGEGKIFRPYRDVRFSADKTPYKTHIAATIGDGYVMLGKDGLGVGAGMHEMAPDQLERYREAVADDASGPALERVIADAKKKDVEVSGHGALKTAPRGYPKDHPRIELLRYKGVVAWKDWPAASWMGTKKVKDRVTEFFRNAQPLNDWLAKNVGPSTAPMGRR
jgi:uncharacterized protein (TIGR02453 family)